MLEIHQEREIEEINVSGWDRRENVKGQSHTLSVESRRLTDPISIQRFIGTPCHIANSERGGGGG